MVCEVPTHVILCRWVRHLSAILRFMSSKSFPDFLTFLVGWSVIIDYQLVISLFQQLMVTQLRIMEWYPSLTARQTVNVFVLTHIALPSPDDTKKENHVQAPAFVIGTPKFQDWWLYRPTHMFCGVRAGINPLSVIFSHREHRDLYPWRTGYFPWNHSERKYKSLCCHYRFGIFKRKREKKIMVMLMLPKEQWV